MSVRINKVNEQGKIKATVKTIDAALKASLKLLLLALTPHSPQNLTSIFTG